MSNQSEKSPETGDVARWFYLLVEKKIKIEISPLFGRDLVALGSSGLPFATARPGRKGTKSPQSPPSSARHEC